MKIDDLVRIFCVAVNDEAMRTGSLKTIEHAGIKAVVLALKLEFCKAWLDGNEAEWLNDSLDRGQQALAIANRIIDEILGEQSPEVKAELPANKGEENGLRRNRNGFRDGAERVEGRQEGGAGGLERQGDVSVSRARLAVRGEPSPAEHLVTDGDDGELQGAHRHEDGGRPVCSLGGVSERFAGGRLDDNQVASEKAAGVPTSNDGTVEAKSLKQEAAVSPAADPAPAVCEWTAQDEGPAHEIWKTGCGTMYERAKSTGWCNKCKLPIKFTEVK